MATAPELLWTECGRCFAFADMVHWQTAGQQTFEQAAALIDTIVLGPHATAAFPAELAPFVNPALTLRKQCDFSDVLTGTLGRLWAAMDPHTVFVENPHPRLAGDANRPPPTDAIADLREFFHRLARLRQGEQTSFAGVDAVRPITFSGEQVLREPESNTEWNQLAAALQSCMSHGITPYRTACQHVVDTVLAAGAPRAVRVFSLHDTMNTKMRADGAILVERPASELLPAVANLGNRGNARGEANDPSDPITLDAAYLRELQTHWGKTLNVSNENLETSLRLNHPYKGAYETVLFGQQLAPYQGLGSGAVQVEFLREYLMGPLELAELHAPGSHWPPANEQVLTHLAQALSEANDRMRHRPADRREQRGAC